MVDATLCLLIQGHPPEKLLLGFKKIGFGQGKWGGFGGKVEPGETIARAAVRELREETGLRVAESNLQKTARLTFMFPHRSDWSQVVHVFVALVWKGLPIESDEMRPAWFSVSRIPYEKMWDDSLYWLPLVLAGKHLDAQFTFAADNTTVTTAQISALTHTDGQFDCRLASAAKI